MLVIGPRATLTPDKVRSVCYGEPTFEFVLSTKSVSSLIHEVFIEPSRSEMLSAISPDGHFIHNKRLDSRRSNIDTRWEDANEVCEPDTQR